MIKFPNFKEAKINIDEQTQLTIGIVFCIAFALISYISILGVTAGALPSALGVFLRSLLGRGSFMIPIFFLVGAYILIQAQAKKAYLGGLAIRLYWGLGLVQIALVGLLALYYNVTKIEHITNNDRQGGSGGFLGFIITSLLTALLGDLGSYLVLISVICMGGFVITGRTFVEFATGLKDIIRNPSLIWDMIPNFFAFLDHSDKEGDISDQRVEKPKENIPVFEEEKSKPKEEKKDEEEKDYIDVEATKAPKTKPVFNFAGVDGNVTEMIAEEMRVEESKEKGKKDWLLPTYELISDKKSKSDAGDIEGNKNTIKKTLENFGISVTMGDVSVGPTVSQYTLQPSDGVRLSSIDALQRDLALSLAATNIRIQAPIPGKKLVGIEIPNYKKEIVRLRDMIQTKEFLYFPEDLPIAVGKDVTGINFFYPLSKMPHLLVAGATGAGKSVWINGLLLSLLYRYTKDKLGLILVDMKRVELKLYDGIPHLLIPVITDSEKAVNALKWTVLEMDKRYKILEDSGKRNIKDYNKHAYTYNKDPLKYLVFVIDELGDLMMLAKSEVEPIIVRLTQMSRAVGIHIVLGTQRPDTQIVTGLIKANVPTRIAFAVASQIDSRVILDQVGAEKLLGHGDGLIVTPSQLGARRFQGALVDEAEVRKVVQFLKDQVNDIIEDTNYDGTVAKKPTVKLNIPGMQSDKEDYDEDGNVQDSSYEVARKLVIQYQKASTSFLQNRMGIGYPKAAKIIMQLEENGVVGPANGSKARDVYIQEIDEV